MSYNPGEVTVEDLGADGYYFTCKRVNGEMESLHVPALQNGEHPWTWAMDLDDSQLEAAIQIYYDRWNFKTGDQQDRDLFEVAILERARRLLPHSTFAPGMFTAQPQQHGNDPLSENHIKQQMNRRHNQ